MVLLALQSLYMIYICFICLGQDLRFIEYFAGKGRASLCARLSGRLTASLDIDYHEPRFGASNFMDILTDSGMASFGSTLYGCFTTHVCVSQYNDSYVSSNPLYQSTYHSFISECGWGKLFRFFLRGYIEGPIFHDYVCPQAS